MRVGEMFKNIFAMRITARADVCWIMEQRKLVETLSICKWKLRLPGSHRRKSF